MTTPTPHLSVDIRLDGIEIDGVLHPYPLLLSDLEALLDEEPMDLPTSVKSQTALWWRESGVQAVTTNDVHATSVQFTVADPAHDVRIEGRPYGEIWGPSGPTYPNHDFGRGFLLARRSQPGGDVDQHVMAITVEQKLPRGSAKRKPAATKAATATMAAPAVVDAVEFHDFNFKLLVIQALMYDAELLTPRFNVHEFVDQHADRDIDLGAEGYDPIPEVLAHFRELQIPRSLLAEVTDIYQDGGNEIYMQIAPLWSGEEDVFDVADMSDVAMLPNLTSMTLLTADDEMIAALEARGINAEEL